MKDKSRLVILTIFSVLWISSCTCSSNNQTETAYYVNDSTPKTTILIPQPEHDFGSAVEREQLVHRYKVINTGDRDLFIRNVIASCGCTVPSYEPKPIPPKDSTYIEVVFDTSGRPGTQLKSVRVITNTEPPVHLLTFRCEVKNKND